MSTTTTRFATGLAAGVRWEHSEKDIRFSIPATHFQDILEHCDDTNAETETGGVLAARITNDVGVVTGVMGPAPNSSLEPENFTRGSEGVDGWLDERYEYDGSTYVGEWHYHPDAWPVASDMDHGVLHTIAAEGSGYNCPMPISVIVGGSESAGYTANAYLYDRDKHDPQKLIVV